ncbi:MAG TPA: autotransporter outer membrane beta-barrel domain-containing protein [Acetobacteraceae bacterium]|nr:autotransporter outer membrane beta-barrel domain-containing protein [Acetobacteraceae bacterium]
MSAPRGASHDRALRRRLPRGAAVLLLAASGFAAPAAAQTVDTGTIDTVTLDYTTLDYDSTGTFLTGIRGGTLTGQYVIPTSGANGGLIYSIPAGTWIPLPEATPNGVNFPGAIDDTPYGPSFGSYGGILRVVGAYQTSSSSPYDLGYLYDSAAPPGENTTTLQYPNPPGDTTLFTIAHSTFGDEVVGNYDTRLVTGNSFIYEISTGTYTTLDKPGAVSTTAYGIWGDVIAGGYTEVGPGGGPAPGHGFIYNEATGVWTSYDYPGAVETHFEGITGGGQAGTYNLAVDWVDAEGQPHAAVLHIDAAGSATWYNIAVPGAVVTSANSIYEGEVAGVYTTSSGTVEGFTAEIPGIYNPIENSGTIATSAPGTPALAAAPGDDVLNNGLITTSGAKSPGIATDTYGVVTNNGEVIVSGPGSAAVEMNGTEGTLLNAGLLRAGPGGYAIATGPTASGSIVVSGGTIDGPVDFLAGSEARFENSGWLGISAPGTGATHVIQGTFAQTDSGTLALRVGADASHDALEVQGSGQFAGTLTLEPQAGLYQPQTSYPDLVSASNALWGTFGTVDSSSPFFRASLTSGTDSFGAELTRIPFDAFPGLTPNQSAVGGALEQDYQTALSTGQGAGLFANLLGAEADPADVPAAYDALSGAGLTGIQQTSLAANADFVEAIRREGAFWLSGEGMDVNQGAPDPAQAGPGSWRAWAQGMGGGGQLDGDPGLGTSPLSMNSWGLVAGLSYEPTANVVVGAAVGGSSSTYSVSDLGTSGSIPGGEGGLYALGRWGGFYASGTLAYGRYHVTSSRDIAPLGLGAVADSSFDEGALTGRLETGYVFRDGAVNVTPFVAYEGAALWEPAFSESVGSGALPLGLAVEGQTTTSQQSFLGFGVDRTVPLSGRWTLLNSARASWAHEFDTERSLTASFEADPAASFFVLGAPAASNSALLTDAVYFARGPRLSLFAAFGADVSGEGQMVGGSMGLQLTW